MSARLAEYLAEGMTLFSILALVLPAYRLVKLQEHNARMSNLIANARIAGNDDTAELAEELRRAKNDHADRLYIVDKIAIWVGIFLAIGASVTKIIWVIPAR